MASAQGIRYGKAYVEIGANIDKLKSGLQSAKAAVQQWGSNLKAAGQQMMSAGLAMAAPIGLGVLQFATFEQAMARVRGLTGATEEDFVALSAEARRLGATTAFTAQDAANAMGNFAQAGLTVQEIMQATGPALDMAASGQLDMATASDILIKVMKGMKIPFSEAARVTDVLAYAAAKANTTLPMLMDAFKFVGPLANSAGMSLEDTTAFIMMLSDAGIQAEMAGTTLRGMLISLTSPSNEASAEMARLGINVADASGNFRGMPAIVADLENALSGMGSADKLRILGTIFPARQASGAAEAIASGSASITRSMRRLRDESSGFGKQFAATMLDTVSGAWKIFVSQVQELAIVIGETLGPTIRTVAKFMEMIIPPITEWIKENKHLVLWIAGVSAGLLIAGAAVFILGTAIAIASWAFVPLIALVSALGIVWKALFWYFTNPKVILFDVIKTFFLVTFPEILGLAKDTLSDLMHVFDGIGSTFSTMWAGITDAIKAGDMQAAMDILTVGLQLAWETLINNLIDLWRRFQNRVDIGAQNVVHGAGGVIDDWFTDVSAGFNIITFGAVGSPQETPAQYAARQERFAATLQTINNQSPLLADRSYENQLRQRLRALAAAAEAEANLTPQDQMVREYADHLGVSFETARARLAEEWNRRPYWDRDEQGNIVQVDPLDAALARFGVGVGIGTTEAPPVDPRLGMGETGSFGSFIGAAISGFAGGNYQQRTAEAVEAIRLAIEEQNRNRGEAVVWE